MTPAQFRANVNADIRMMLERDLDNCRADAEAYRFLRDAPAGLPDLDAAVLWEELLTTGCRGADWDKTVAALRDLYAERGWT